MTGAYFFKKWILGLNLRDGRLVAPCLPPKILHSHCFQFLQGITVVPREIEDNGYVKFWGVNKVHYGLCENGEQAKVYIHY